MSKGKDKTQRQTIVHKIQHIKQQIVQHQSHVTPEVNYVSMERSLVLASPVVPAILLLNDISSDIKHVTSILETPLTKFDHLFVKQLNFHSIAT